MARLFFALWPDEDAAQRLGRLALEVARSCGGKPVAAARIHLTLAFLGEVDDERVDAAASAVPRAACFEAAVDRIGSFRGARVAWAGTARPAEGLVRLQASLSAALLAAGFELESRPFAPHLTLARRIARPVEAAAIEPVAWNVREAALVRTDAGSYTTLRTFRLAMD